MVLFKKILHVAVVCCFGLMLLVNPAFADSKKLVLSAAVCPPGGAWSMGMSAVGKLFTDAWPNSEFRILPGAAVSNPLQLQSRRADVTLTQHVCAANAYTGVEPYKKPSPDIRSIVNINDITRMHVMVREDSPIHSFRDIKEMKYPLKLCHGVVGNVAEYIGRKLLEEYGVTYADIKNWGGKLYNNGQNDVASMVQDGLVDCFFWFGPGQAAHVQEACSGVKLRWLPIDDPEIMKRMQEKYSMIPGVIPADYFNGMVGKDIPCVTNPTEIMVRADLPEDVVYALTKAIIEGKEDIARTVPMWGHFDLQSACRNLGAPLHPGAERYYKEKGAL